MDLEPLSPALGAVVAGLDPRARPSDAERSALREALRAHGLLLWRGVDLSDEEQVELLRAVWGEPLVENESGRAFQFVSNARPDGILRDDAYAFHSDHAFMPDPVEVISLAAIELPAAGTETWFANAQRAAAELPQPLRARCAGRRARHALDPEGRPQDVRLFAAERPPASCPHAFHPILWREGGREILYVNQQQTDEIEGLSRSEGDALLRALFDHLYSPRYRYAHAWRPGDLVVWDNRMLQHARDRVPSGVRRSLRRVSVGGTPVWRYFSTRSFVGAVDPKPGGRLGA